MDCALITPLVGLALLHFCCCYTRARNLNITGEAYVALLSSSQKTAMAMRSVSRLARRSCSRQGYVARKEEVGRDAGDLFDNRVPCARSTLIPPFPKQGAVAVEKRTSWICCNGRAWDGNASWSSRSSSNRRHHIVEPLNYPCSALFTTSVNPRP